MAVLNLTEFANFTLAFDALPASGLPGNKQVLSLYSLILKRVLEYSYAHNSASEWKDFSHSS